MLYPIQRSQLIGILKYEFRMHWRRRALLILTWGILFVAIISVLIAGDNLRQLSSLEAAADLKHDAVVSALILTIFSPIGISLAVILPILVADAIPLDRQYGVRDLLDTMPLPLGIYLAGKLLGMWTAVLNAIGLVMILVGAIWWLVAGAFNLAPYLEVFLVAITSITVLNGSLGVLIPAGLSTRRQAIIFTLGGLLFLFWLFGGLAPSGADFTDMFGLMRLPIINHYLLSHAVHFDMISPAIKIPTFQTVLITIMIGIGQLIVVFTLVQWGLAWHNERQ